MSQSSDDAKAVAALLVLAALGAVGYGLYQAGAWFLNQFGVEGLVCLLSGLAVVFATELGTLFLLFRATDEKVRKCSPREAAGKKRRTEMTFLFAPMLAAFGIHVILCIATEPPEVLAGIIAVSGLLIYEFAFFVLFDKYIEPKHAVFVPKLFCPHCAKLVVTNSAWVCGDCFENNWNSSNHSFLQSCHKCGSAPREYVCYYDDCGQLIDLGPVAKAGVRLAQHPAKLWREAQPPQPETDEAKLRRRGAEVEELQHRIRVAEMDAALAAAEQERAKHSPGSNREQKERSLAQFKAHHSDVQEIAERELERAKREFADNPKARRRHNLVIETWRDDALAQGPGES